MPVEHYPVFTGKKVSGMEGVSKPDLHASLYVVQEGSKKVTIVNLLKWVILNFTNITTLTGGGATALDGVVTAGAEGLPSDITVCINIAGFQLWKLEDGDDAENGTTVIRPDDFDNSTNQRVWKRFG